MFCNSLGGASGAQLNHAFHSLLLPPVSKFGQHAKAELRSHLHRGGVDPLLSPDRWAPRPLRR